MEIKTISISYRSNGRREGIVARREAGCGRVTKGFSIRVALIAKGLGVGIRCKQIREGHHVRDTGLARPYKLLKTRSQSDLINLVVGFVRLHNAITIHCCQQSPMPSRRRPINSPHLVNRIGRLSVKRYSGYLKYFIAHSLLSILRAQPAVIAVLIVDHDIQSGHCGTLAYIASVTVATVGRSVKKHGNCYRSTSTTTLLLPTIGAHAKCPTSTPKGDPSI